MPPTGIRENAAGAAVNFSGVGGGHAVAGNPASSTMGAKGSQAPMLSITGSGDRKRVRLESLVFLSSVPHTHSHVVMKKMLHPPTMGLYCLVELPVSGAEHQRMFLRASLQAWLGSWCEMQREHPDLFVGVCEAFWDAPQGYPMGILCEYMPLGSLDELVQAAGGLPEEALREVAHATLKALGVLHSAEPPMVHGCLKPSQVLFGIDGRPRLSFGLDQRLKGPQGLSGRSHGADVGPGVAGDQASAVDIFDLGLLLLVSALGGLDVLLGAIAYASEVGPNSIPAAHSMICPDTCSLLQEELRGAVAAAVAVSGPGENDGRMPVGSSGNSSGGHVHGGADMGYLPAASDLLFNRNYSEPFLSFVSTCLEAHNRSSPISAQELLQHEFLLEPSPAGPLVYLRDMQELARVLNETPEHDPSCFGPAKKSWGKLPGVAPSVAQRSHMYVANIAHSVGTYCSPPPWRASVALGRERSKSESEMPQRVQRQEWDTLVTDTARTLGLPTAVVQQMLDAQLERQTQFTARDRRNV